MSYENFEVVEANERFGFARLKLEGSDELFHAELYPDDGESLGPLQLRVGDRVTGLRRGQSISRVSWRSRVPPPRELIDRMREVLLALKEAQFEAVITPEALAERLWRNARDEGDFEVELEHRLPRFFSPEGEHPFEDEELLARFSRTTQRRISDFDVKPVAGEPRFKVSPGDESVLAQEGTREDPLPVFRPLIDRANALLEQGGHPERWVQVHKDWRFARPDLVALLVRAGLLRGALLN